MSSLSNLEVIVPTYKSRDLTRAFVKSFEHFSPDDMEITFHLVENSSDTSYKEESSTWAQNVIWHSNPDADTKEDATSNKGSWANCSAIDFVKHDISTEFVFMCHNDCVVTSALFFEELKKKVEEGFQLVGTLRSPARNNYLHSSGLLVKTDLFQEVGVTPEFHRDIDVCEVLTDYCADNDIPYFAFESTFSDKSLYKHCNEPWKSLGANCGVDRTLDTQNREVIYAHLGRGSEKNFGKYGKPGKVMYSDWSSLCDSLLEGEKNDD